MGWGWKDWAQLTIDRHFPDKMPRFHRHQNVNDNYGEQYTAAHRIENIIDEIDYIERRIEVLEEKLNMLWKGEQNEPA